LAPERCLPVSQLTVKEALEKLKDSSQVKPHAPS
jgi:hypothetical protein